MAVVGVGAERGAERALQGYLPGGLGGRGGGIADLCLGRDEAPAVGALAGHEALVADSRVPERQTRGGDTSGMFNVSGRFLSWWSVGIVMVDKNRVLGRPGLPGPGLYYTRTTTTACCEPPHDVWCVHIHMSCSNQQW